MISNPEAEADAYLHRVSEDSKVRSESRSKLVVANGSDIGVRRATPSLRRQRNGSAKDAVQQPFSETIQCPNGIEPPLVRYR